MRLETKYNNGKINPLETGDFQNNFFLQVFVHDSITNISTERTFLQDFLVILKRSLQNYQKILKKCFLGTTRRTLMLSANIKSHTGVLSVSKGLSIKWSSHNRIRVSRVQRLKIQKSTLEPSLDMQSCCRRERVWCWSSGRGIDSITRFRGN